MADKVPSTSPGGSFQWIPRCVDEKKPRVDMFFPTVDDGYRFYIEYGRACGFDVRRESENKCADGTVISQKTLVCSRFGVYKRKRNNVDDELDGRKIVRRKCKVIRCGCTAKMVLVFRGLAGYCVKEFVEVHNHRFADDDGKQFMKLNRDIDPAQVMFCVQAASLQIGPVRSHALIKEMCGGYKNVGATSNDFKNIKRDFKQYIGEDDGAMIIRKFKNLKKACEGFVFDYQLDEGGSIDKLFWCDPVARRNYDLFGDFCSVDATFRSNKYDMKFVPFTGTNNHKKNVTFAAGLISREDADSFEWLFRAFLSAMGGREPIYIVTDQCPATKKALPIVFKSARHRLCAWHIMRKFCRKIKMREKRFKRMMNKVSYLVYRVDLTPEQFEEQWASDIILRYNLGHINWLKKIYRIRKDWVSAYFHDTRMGGLCRTTSISESSNSFFNDFYVTGDTLIEFYKRFETAMDKQRYDNNRLNNDDIVAKPGIDTDMRIEVHAADVYTCAVFYEVQIELKATIYEIEFTSSRIVEGTKHLVVSDAAGLLFEVKHMMDNNYLECSCGLFMRRGIPCRHMFFALKQARIDKLPAELVVDRWKKNAEELASESINKHVDDYKLVMEKDSNIISKVMLKFHTCLSLVGYDNERIDLLMRHLVDAENELSVDAEEISPKKKRDGVIEMIVGPKIVEDEDLVIKNPQPCISKGSAKRIKSSCENTHYAKPRTCSLCGGKGHNKRSCVAAGKENQEIVSP